MSTTIPNRHITAALRAFGAGLIDYAGLFPPAELPMAAAVANYAAYRRGADAWLLGRFVLPAARLAEFEVALATVAASAPPPALVATPNEAIQQASWRLSALVATQPARLTTDLEQIAQFNARHTSGSAIPQGTTRGATGQSVAVVVDAIETKAQSADEIAGIAQTLAAWRDAPPGLVVYVEIPLSDATPALLARLAAANLCGKVRTGGVTADAFPSAEALAAFLSASVAARLPIKATAGLHHAMRATYRLTYAPDSPSAPMYGFLNVFLAAAYLFDGASLADARDILCETDAAAFHFDNDGVVWRGRRIATARLAQARADCAVSYGSCSFAEPIEHLQAMGLL